METRALEEPSRRWEDNIKINLKDVRIKGVNCDSGQRKVAGSCKIEIL
jgi:hypothetical protein